MVGIFVSLFPLSSLSLFPTLFFFYWSVVSILVLLSLQVVFQVLRSPVEPRHKEEGSLPHVLPGGSLVGITGVL